MIRRIASFVLLLVVSPVFILNVSAADKEKKIYPSQVPISHKPASMDESRVGVGYNRMDVTSDWEDDFFTNEAEDIGELKYTAHNLVVGFIESKSHSTTTELALLAGIVESEADTDQYFSKVLGKNVRVDNSGDGYDLGVRFLTSRTFHTQEKSGGDKMIDWNLSLSLHAALFYIDGTFEALSVDGQEGNTYDEEEWGIFARPIVALQPIVYLSDRVSLIPYVGAGSKVTVSEYYWEDKVVVSGGSPLPGQLGDGEGYELDYTGIETYLGFDFLFALGAAKNRNLSVGAAVSKIFGDNDSDFSEFHIVYYF